MTDAAGVTAAPDLVATLLLVSGTGVVIGGVAGAVATAATGD
ncbi:hypothetical protein [Halorubrum trapanicum]|nr:hypothetical protein [Halorubrum trapanicum]